jgi:hypothetical protein
MRNATSYQLAGEEESAEESGAATTSLENLLKPLTLIDADKKP